MKEPSSLTQDKISLTVTRWQTSQLSKVGLGSVYTSLTLVITSQESTQLTSLVRQRMRGGVEGRRKWRGEDDAREKESE